MNMAGLTIWARAVELKLRRHKKVVISDGRFPDEVNMVKRNNGKIVRIFRQKYKSKDETVHKHVSETQVDKLFYHERINNNGTLEELEAMVGKLA